MPAHRKPVALKLSSGAFKKNPQRLLDILNVPLTSGTVGAAPSHLSMDQKSIWDEVILKAPSGVLTNADEGELELLTVLLDYVRKLSVSTNGAKVDVKAMTAINSIYQQFGMSPASRNRVQTASPLTLPEVNSGGTPRHTFASV